MMKKYCYLITILIAAISPAAYAGTLKGKVTDSKGVTLPFAIVYVQNTTKGTSANAEGLYQLNLEPGTYKVVSQYMGFSQSTHTITIKGNETVTQDFSLKDQSLEMKEVVISNEDPAYAIIRKTIDKRSFHLKQVKSFQTGIYLKGVLRNRLLPDVGIMKLVAGKDAKGKKDKKEIADALGLDSTGKAVLYLCEEKADYYSQEPNKERTVIHSVRESGNPNGLGFAQMPPVITFYENNINLIDNINPPGFISPISENALTYYRYKYEGEFKEGKYTIDKIKVIPRRAYEPCFEGTIYIVDGDWAIHSLDMLLTKKSGMSFLDTMHITQLFLPLKEDTWVIKNQVWYPTIKILGFDITGYFVTVYDNQKVNEPIPDTIFQKKVVSVYDKTSNKKDTAYWTEARPVPLEADESKDYGVKDSIRLHDENPHIKDSVRRRNNKLSVGGILLTGFSQTAKGSKLKVDVNPVLPVFDGMVNYNTVEGLNIAPKITWNYKADTGKTLSGKVAARYGVNNEHFNAIAKLAYRSDDREWRGRYWAVGVEGGKYVFQYNPENPIPEFYNTISTLFYRKNYMKIYERWEGALALARNYGNGFRWNGKFEFQRRMPLYNTTGYNWASSNVMPFSDNLPSELSSFKFSDYNALLLKLSASYQPGYTYTLYPDYKMPQSSNWPVFTLAYEKGIPNALNSKVDFDKWRFDIKDNIRLKMLGSLSYVLAAGGFLNAKSVGIPDMMHLYGNQTMMATPYLKSFQLAPYYMYSNTAKIYGEAHLEYNLQGLLTNKIPLLRQARWYLLLGNNTFYAGQNNYYTEAFVGIDNLGWKLLRFLRVDFVESWDAKGVNHAGFRIGINSSILQVSVGNGGGGEW